MGAKRKRAAILTRVSTNEQETDRQVRELQEFARKEQIEVVSVIQETISGSSSRYSDRDGLHQALSLAKANKIDLVLVWEVSRISRRPTHIEQFINELIESEIPVYVTITAYIHFVMGKETQWPCFFWGCLRSLPTWKQRY